MIGDKKVTKIADADNESLQVNIENLGTKNAIVTTVADGFDVGNFDTIELTYVPSGNGAGEIETVTYKSSAVTTATITLAYDASDRITSVVKS